MKRKFDMVRIDENYCDYLREYDSRVIFNSDDKSLRPFIGVVFSVNGLDYFAPLTSPKPNFSSRKNSPIFQKIAGGLLGAIRLNSMIPVPPQFAKKIDLNHYCLTDAELNYQTLLKKQIRWVNNNADKIEEKAKRLYDTYVDKTLSRCFRQFCCNFPLLEEKCHQFMWLNGLSEENFDSTLEKAMARAAELNNSSKKQKQRKIEVPSL